MAEPNYFDFEFMITIELVKAGGDSRTRKEIADELDSILNGAIYGPQQSIFVKGTEYSVNDFFVEDMSK